MSTAYDEVAYPSRPFRQTHPRQLGVAAALLDLPYAPMEQARVLEIGCGEGGNIIPMAMSYPEATVVGFDLAASAIAAGQAVVERLGLGNIQLRVLDILEAGPELGTFDYIIAHGVYSWVPGEVREALLALVRRSLAPEGLAFVSYNALPGCHVRLLVREMVMHHLRGVEGFEARLAATREFLTLLIENTAEADPMAAAVQAQCRSMLERDPRVLFHDELGPIYEPFYLTDFLAAGARHGLQFVAEAEGVWWREELFPSSRGKAVRRLIGEDTAELHQYMDFLAARLFRQTILCRAEARLDRKVEHRRIRGLWASALAKPIDPEPDLDSLAPVRFELSSKVAISLSEPVLKRALFTLSQAWPQAVSVSSLADHPDVDEGLLQLFTGGHVDLSTGPAPMTTTPGERPLASPLARLHAEHPSGEFCGLDHNFVQIEDEQGRRFVKLLDGTRTRADLAAEMADAGPPEELAGRIAAYLDRLAHLGLLIA